MLEFTTIAKAKKQTGLSYLGGINLSAKMIKNKKVGHYTYSLNLSPANTSGYNVCSHSTPECKSGCLATSGRTAVEIFSCKNTIQNARIKKTRLFFEEAEFFMSWLIADLKALQIKAKKDGFFVSARLNTISDIDWQYVLVNDLNIFQIFPEIQFYDYTKNINKFINKPSNYHLTYSFTGRNWLSCEALLEREFNVAIIFNVKHEIDLPLTYNGYKVINGDLTDARFMDEKGCIVGLKFKRIADREAEKKVINSCFVVQPDNIACGYANVNVREFALV